MPLPLLLLLVWPVAVLPSCDHIVSDSLPGVKLRVERPPAPLTHPGCVPWVVLIHPVTRAQYCVRSQGAGQGAGGTPTNKLTCSQATFNTTAAGCLSLRGPR